MPIFVDFFIGFVENNPNPSTDDDFTVRYGGRGRYTSIYIGSMQKICEDLLFGILRILMQMGIFDKMYGLLGLRVFMHLFTVIYAYICVDVKDRSRAKNQSKFGAYIYARSNARGGGAYVRV